MTRQGTGPHDAHEQPAGTAPSLADCFAAHHQRVYGWARLLTRQHADALDLSQEVFLRLARYAGPRTPAARLVAWLRRVTQNCAIDRWRAARPALPLADADAVLTDAASPTGHLEHAEQTDRLRAALAGLSEQQRLVLLAKECDGLTFEQVAAELGITASTAKTHYVRALRTLRDHPQLRLTRGDAI